MYRAFTWPVFSTWAFVSNLMLPFALDLCFFSGGRKKEGRLYCFGTHTPPPPSQSLGYLPQCGPLQKLWGFINFDCTCDFLLQHLIHVSKFYFCFHGENSLFHFLRDTKMCHCTWSSKTQQEIRCHFYPFKNRGLGAIQLYTLYEELCFWDHWHVTCDIYCWDALWF